MSINPPSTAEATINGALTATTGGDEDDEDDENGNGGVGGSGGGGDTEEMLMNKSEFLLNELTGGDSQSPLTSADIMAIMMMTMSNAATADQISLNGVSSSLATTALPTVLTPLYTDNEQYGMHQQQQRRRRHRSSSSAAKKYLRRRRKNGEVQGGQQQQTGAGGGQKARKKTVNTNQDGDVSVQNEEVNKSDGGNENAAVELVKKQKHRKRKRILNLIATNASNAITAADNQMGLTNEANLTG